MELKTKIFEEKNKTNNLKECFIEMRNSKENMKNDMKDKEKLTLVEEKMSLESTLLSLSEEVEFLSQKNEQFLKDLLKRDFYEEYKGTNEELENFRKIHFSLLNMRENNMQDVRLHSNSQNVILRNRFEPYSSDQRGKYLNVNHKVNYSKIELKL